MAAQQKQLFRSGRSVALEEAMLDGLPDRIERYMDVLSVRQRLVAANIANVDTPGYQTQDLDFNPSYSGSCTAPAAPCRPCIPFPTWR